MQDNDNIILINLHKTVDKYKKVIYTLLKACMLCKKNGGVKYESR